MNSNTAFPDFVQTLAGYVESPGPGALSIIVFETLDQILRPECDKLAGWGYLVLANHAPPGSIVTPWEEGTGCVMALAAPAETAAAEAAVFAEQLNRLPLYGQAPGNAWRLYVLDCRRQPEAVRDLLTRMRASGQTESAGAGLAV